VAEEEEEEEERRHCSIPTLNNKFYLKMKKCKKLDKISTSTENKMRKKSEKKI